MDFEKIRGFHKLNLLYINSRHAVTDLLPAAKKEYTIWFKGKDVINHADTSKNNSKDDTSHRASCGSNSHTVQGDCAKKDSERMSEVHSSSPKEATLNQQSFPHALAEEIASLSEADSIDVVEIEQILEQKLEAYSGPLPSSNEFNNYSPEAQKAILDEFMKNGESQRKSSEQYSTASSRGYILDRIFSSIIVLVLAIGLVASIISGNVGGGILSAAAIFMLSLLTWLFDGGIQRVLAFFRDKQK